MASAPSPATGESDWRNRVKELAEAVSTQAQVANRTWLALVTVALLALIPRTPTSAGNIPLPFNLGEVPLSSFHVLVFFLLVVLATAFASAHSQQVRAQKLAHSVIDSLSSLHCSSDGPLRPREYFDMLRKPSLNRVASLAQSLRGKYQFFSTVSGLPRWLQLVTVIYYGLLKIVSFSIYYLLPTWALFQAYQDFSASGLLHALAVLGALVAGFTLMQVFCFDVLYAAKVLRLLWKPTR